VVLLPWLFMLNMACDAATPETSEADISVDSCRDSVSEFGHFKTRRQNKSIFVSNVNVY
jgi:hypothetical protein